MLQQHIGKIDALWQETPSLLGLQVIVAPEVRALHVRPGQYALVSHGNTTPVFLAIASRLAHTSDAHPTLEFLVGTDAQARLKLHVDAEVRVGSPEGAGFPIERARGRDILIFAVGSALSACRPLLSELVRRRGEFERILFFAGARSWEEHPYRRWDAEWTRAGVEVRRSVSKPWVQEIFRADPVPLHNAFAFACGMPEMIRDLSDVLVEHGLSPDRIGVNW